MTDPVLAMSDQQSDKGLPGGSLNLEVIAWKQKLENKEQEMAELMTKFEISLNEREKMEEQLIVMKGKVKEADSKLNEVKAETEVVLRQNESNQQELAMIRRRSLVGGGGQIITQMYETILLRYEELKTVHDELQRKMNEEVDRRTKLEKQLSNLRMPNDAEKESLTQQNQALREHIETLKKEINRQAKDLNRIREERTSFKREYSLVMSERDAVHKEMDKMQEDLILKQKENHNIDNELRRLRRENEKLKAQLASQQHGTVASLDYSALQEELYAAVQERKQALNEKDAKVHEAYTAQQSQKQAMKRIEDLTKERDMLKAEVDLGKQQLDDAIMEVKDTTKWRELAFSERDKLNRELDESRKVCDKLTEERENLFKQLEEAVKELDSMKEAKKRLQVKLHEMRTAADTRNLESTENAHSHDSAIDSGDWESETNDACQKFSHVKRILPSQHDITIEAGIFIKQSNTPGVNVGDRVLALGEIPVTNKSLREVSELLSRKSAILLHLMKCVPFHKNSTSLASSHDDFNKHVPNGFPTSPRKLPTGENNVWTGDNAQVILRRPKTNHLTPLDIDSAQTASSEKTTDKRESTIFHCEESSEVSEQTVYSEPFYGVAKAEGVKSNNESLSNSYSGGKKKKPKMSSSRFWIRKKKSKSVTSPSDISGSPSGTWPRLDSPSISNVMSSGGGGRFSVLMRKKNRPLISPNTFTPPDGPSAGHTPPTPLRHQLTISPISLNSTVNSPPQFPPVCNADVTPLSSRDQTNSITTRTRHHHEDKYRRKARPLSAPIGTLGLSMWQDGVVDSADHASTSVSSTKKNYAQAPPAVTNIATPSPSQPQRVSPRRKDYPRVSPSPSPSPALSNRSSNLYQRQQSVPESSKLSLALPPSCFASLNTSTTSTSSKPRNAHSLPRPTSASKEPTFSISHTHESRKARTMECRRIRIPSEVSVGKMFNGSDKGSITLSSDRSSIYLFSSNDQPSVNSNSARSTPHPESSVSSLSVASSTHSARSRKPPVTNDPRFVTMVRGTEPIGISIVSGETGGIFVSRLTDNSLASKAGLEYGDQLLEFNGVNLRNAKEIQARVIMSQTQPGDDIKFLVQYNLEKYKQSIESNLSDTLGISRPLPYNSPVVSEEVEEGTITPGDTPRASPQVEDALRNQRLNEPRYVFMSDGCANVKLLGGNDVGIYVASLLSNEETLTDKPSDLKVADRIIEFNSVSFANITLEYASQMISHCCTGASFCVIYEPNRFKQIYGVPGDHFYVRTLFDHITEHDSALKFTRNSILLVENTYPDYVTGQWIASLVDEQGVRSTRGRIPSKITWEKERENSLHFSDDVTSTTGSASGKRLSGSGRRSFFKRLKPHRTSSRSSGDIRLHRSPSENSLESTAEIASESLGAYQVVEKHSSFTSRRPVVVFGPHASLVVEKLTREHTQQFVKCCLNSNIEMPQPGDIIETYNYVTGIRVLTGDILKQTMNQFPGRHVLLESTVDAIDRLHSIKVYPIIAFIKYTSAKKVKESQERIAGREKFNNKQCKEILEKQSSIEQTLLSKYYGTVIINGGPASTVALKVSKVVSHEHSKVLWLPSNSNLLNY